MIGNILSALAFLKRLWDAILTFLGYIKKEQHEREMKEIDDAAKRAADPDLSLEERMKAAKELEDAQNSHT